MIIIIIIILSFFIFFLFPFIFIFLPLFSPPNLSENIEENVFMVKGVSTNALEGKSGCQTHSETGLHINYRKFDVMETNFLSKMKPN